MHVVVIEIITRHHLFKAPNVPLNALSIENEAKKGKYLLFNLKHMNTIKVRVLDVTKI